MLSHLLRSLQVGSLQSSFSSRADEQSWWRTNTPRASLDVRPFLTSTGTVWQRPLNWLISLLFIASCFVSVLTCCVQSLNGYQLPGFSVTDTLMTISLRTR